MGVEWWASNRKHQWPNGGRFEDFVAKHWDPVWGDRRQELVFIGIGMDEARIRRRLDAALVPANAFAPALWMSLRDPFPAWGERKPEMAE